MIKFKKIRWKNFLSTGNAFTEIVLDKSDNTLIIGENGAGKSTILDALCYGLFGKPFRNINLPTLINSINGSDLLVEIELYIGTHFYFIRRGMKPNIFEIIKDGTLVNQTAKIDYQEYLENFILRWNKKTFTQVAVLGNANFVPFMQLKAADRRGIIDDILDIQIFSVMNEILKKHITLNESNLVENKHQYALLEKECEIKEAHIKKLKEDKKNEIKSLTEDIKEKKKRVIELTSKRNIMMHEASVLKQESNVKPVLENDLNSLRSYHVAISKNVKTSKEKHYFWANTSTCPTCDEPIGQEKKTKKLNEYKDKHNQYLSAVMKLDKKIHENNVKLQKAEEQIKQMQVLLREISSVDSEINMMNKFINDLQSKVDALANFEANFETEEKNLKALEEKMLDLEDKRESLLDDAEHYEVAAQILKDKGIKARIIKQYLPIINKLVNKYLAEQDFFVNFELDEQFKEVIKSRYRDIFSYENFSEGEKQKIDMSLMLTWREVAKLKNSAATNILILDEIFDSSLDAQGVEYLMKLLHGLEKCNLFVISHKGDILQDKFKSVIKFQKSGNYSRIV